jgi:phosphoglycolate phosphatase-like HAD superfamily hydrolase
MFLVGDSRFDMEAAGSVPGVTALGRASTFGSWTLTPQDLKRWGAAWAAFSLAGLPAVLERLARAPAKDTSRRRARSPSK